ncbi:hypothetical protein T12_14126, partial [Trichinella patagoniensis]
LWRHEKVRVEVLAPLTAGRQDLFDRGVALEAVEEGPKQCCFVFFFKSVQFAILQPQFKVTIVLFIAQYNIHIFATYLFAYFSTMKGVDLKKDMNDLCDNFDANLPRVQKLRLSVCNYFRWCVSLKSFQMRHGYSKMSHQIASELLEEQSNARNALYRRHKQEMVMLFRIKEMDTVTLYSGTKTMLDIKKRMQKHLLPYIETQVINDCGIIKWTKSDVKDVFNSCMGFVIKESILSFQQRKSELSERQKKEAAELYDVQMEQWLKLEFRRKKNKPTMIPEIDLEKDVSLWNNSMLSTLNNLQKKQKKRYN